MEETGDGIVVEVEAEAEVLLGVETMMSVHMVVVLVEGILIGPMVTMVGGLEAVVLDVEEGEVEVQRGGIGVQSEKVVQKEGLK